MNNSAKKVLPEAFYPLSEDMSLDHIISAKNSGDFLVGKVILWDSLRQCLKVDLGNNYTGIIPLNEISIYPVLRPNALSPQLYSLIGNNVCVCVKGIQSGEILLSRKENMLKAFNIICSSGEDIVEVYVKSIQQFGLFVDVGHGVSGMIHITDLTISRLRHTSDIGIKKGSSIFAMIQSINSDKFQIDLNYKDLFENLAGSLNVDDLIEVISLDPVNKREDGYFAYINPQTSAIINPLDGVPLPYGSRVVARVRNSAVNKLKLSFVSFI